MFGGKLPESLQAFYSRQLDSVKPMLKRLIEARTIYDSTIRIP
jgi:hypothetical protein